MPKFPNGSLHKNKPSMNTIHVSIHTRNDPPKPSHKKLTRLGRDIHVAWTTRTRPSNMVKTANVMTTRPNTSVSNTLRVGWAYCGIRRFPKFGSTPKWMVSSCRQMHDASGPEAANFRNTIPINSDDNKPLSKQCKIIVPPKVGFHMI